MSKAQDILHGLGGAANIVEVEGCITRLRCEVADPARVDRDALTTISYGVMIAGAAVQVVVGPSADTLAEKIQDLL